MMLRLLPFVVILFVVGCASKPQAPREIEFQGTTIEVSDSLLHTVNGICDTIDMGRMREGEVITNSLRLHNIGEQPFVILSVESSCGCTTIDYPTAPIQSGEEPTLGYTFDSKGFSGWQLKLLKLRTSLGGEPIKIYLTAEVE